MRKITIHELRVFAMHMAAKCNIPMYKLKSNAKREDYINATSVIAAIVLQRWYRRIRSAYKTHVDPITLEQFNGPTFHVHKGYRFDPQTLSQYLVMSGKFKNICTNQPFNDDDLRRLDIYNAQLARSQKWGTLYPKFQHWHVEITKSRNLETQILETIGYLNHMITDAIEGVVQYVMDIILNGSTPNREIYARYINDIMTYGYNLWTYDTSIRITIEQLIETHVGIYRQQITDAYRRGSDTRPLMRLMQDFAGIIDIL